MTMTANGLAKLIEECGEVMKAFGGLVQVLGKKLAYYHTDEHPDGAGSLKERLENEIGDVLAACHMVTHTHELDPKRIAERRMQKIKLFHEWHMMKDNNKDGIDRS